MHEMLPGRHFSAARIRLAFPARLAAVPGITLDVLLLLCITLNISIFARANPLRQSANSAPSGKQSGDRGPSGAKSSDSQQQPLDFTEEVVRDVLSRLQTGIQSHNLQQVLDLFDADSMPGYALTRDQLQAFFDQYDPILFRYKVLQVSEDKGQSSATAEVDMDATPRDETATAIRRSTQMRFDMKLESKGWKIIGLRPKDFFAQ